MEAKCNLILDSCCDLPFEVINRPGIDLINFPFIQGDTEYIDDMYQSMKPKEFYDMMRDKKTPYPSTSQIPIPALTDTFRRALESKIPTVYLAFSSGLSGTLNTAMLIAESLAAEYPDGKLYIVDTRLASIAEGLLALEAINQRENGLTAEEMVAWAEEARFFVGSQFMLEDFDSLERGGRVPANVAKFGSKLDVKPTLSFDLNGKLTLTGIVRGRKKGLRSLVDHYAKKVDRQQTIRQAIVAHADCPKDVERLTDMLRKEDPDILILESNVGPVIGSHVGPGMIAVVFWSDDRRDGISVADRIARRVKGA